VTGIVGKLVGSVAPGVVIGVLVAGQVGFGGKPTAADGPRPGTSRPAPGAARPSLDLPQDMPRAVAAARAARREYGAPVSVALGQMYLESGAGRSGLAVRWRNYFGIKCGSGGPGPIAVGCTPALGTTEYYGGGAVHIADTFRRYRSPEDSFRDWARLVTSGRYAGTRAHAGNPPAFLRQLAAAGYATTPGYAARVQAVIDRNGFGRYDR
jgi:flagellum-specific peptidoglycan hydrolase FlgJ